MQELISVIVPVYNVEKYIHKCVDSILVQTYTNLEIILVDDGSPDNCPAILDEYAKRDSRIKVVHKENGGVSSARNAGLDIATGDYIGFVDSDDFIASDMYEYLHKLINEYSADVAQVSICNVDWTYQVEGDSDTGEPMLTLNRLAYVESMLDGRALPFVATPFVWNNLYRASLIARHRFEESLGYGEDYIFNYSILVNGGYVVKGNEKKYYYFNNENSITREKDFKPKRTGLDIAIQLQHDINNREIEELYQSAECGIMRAVAHCLYRMRKDNLADEYNQYVLKYLKEHKNMIKNKLLSKEYKLILRAYVISPKMATKLTAMYYKRKHKCKS